MSWPSTLFSLLSSPHCRLPAPPVAAVPNRKLLLKQLLRAAAAADAAKHPHRGTPAAAPVVAPGDAAQADVPTYQPSAALSERAQVRG